MSTIIFMLVLIVLLAAFVTYVHRQETKAAQPPHKVVLRRISGSGEIKVLGEWAPIFVKSREGAFITASELQHSNGWGGKEAGYPSVAVFDPEGRQISGFIIESTDAHA